MEEKFFVKKNNIFNFPIENADDLRSEGIRVKGSRGVKVAPAFSATTDDVQVRVSVCARCARFNKILSL